MTFGPMKPPMLAMQLMNPMAAAAAELARNDEGSAQNEGKCAVLEGSFTEVEVYRKILQQEGLTVSVD